MRVPHTDRALSFLASFYFIIVGLVARSCITIDIVFFFFELSLGHRTPPTHQLLPLLLALRG